MSHGGEVMRVAGFGVVCVQAFSVDTSVLLKCIAPRPPPPPATSSARRLATGPATSSWSACDRPHGSIHSCSTACANQGARACVRHMSQPFANTKEKPYFRHHTAVCTHTQKLGHNSSVIVRTVFGRRLPRPAAARPPAPPACPLPTSTCVRVLVSLSVCVSVCLPGWLPARLVVCLSVCLSQRAAAAWPCPCPCPCPCCLERLPMQPVPG